DDDDAFAEAAEDVLVELARLPRLVERVEPLAALLAARARLREDGAHLVAVVRAHDRAHGAAREGGGEAIDASAEDDRRDARAAELVEQREPERLPRRLPRVALRRVLVEERAREEHDLEGARAERVEEVLRVRLGDE